ncbi:hypothetical protein ACH6CV_15600 [Bacillota bacterium Meth-B3]
MIVLDQTLLFHLEDDKTNRGVEFFLPEDCRALRFECEYSPKFIEDTALSLRAVRASIGRYVPRYQLPQYAQNLKMGETLVNLLTFSLDHEGIYLGCAHRHAAHQVHTLSAAGSSPGFVRHGATAGHWRAVINVHSITSPEVAYRLIVSALREGENP